LCFFINMSWGGGRANQSEHERINNHIRTAILEGEAAGAKVRR
jgi:hypothetical protein